VSRTETPVAPRVYVGLAHHLQDTPLVQQAIEAAVPNRDEVADADSVMVATFTSHSPEVTRLP
jgi:hypothetical protein